MDLKDKAEKVSARRAHLQRSFFYPHIERRAKVTPDAVAVEVCTGYIQSTLISSTSRFEAVAMVS